ncbi:MAG: FUSC family protein, partial [Actinomycetota bacterium]
MRVQSLVDKIRAHDPNWYALHRAIRVAVVVPATFAFTFEVIGDPQVATFTSFGGFALLLFADFPGSWTRRLTSYLMLALAGVVLISLGTLASQASWLAVAGMVAVGFAVLFAGTLSATIAAAGRASLLLFILPVTLPGDAADIAPRLAGWGIAVAVAIPVVMLAWPPREHNDLRRYAADTCSAIADVVTARQAGQGHRGDELCARVTTALTALRRTFRGTAFRPVGLTTGSRVLIRLVDELEWLGAIVVALEAEELPAWPDLAKDAAAGACGVLRASAAMLRAGRSRADEYEQLTTALAQLAGQRQRVAAEARDFLDPTTQQGAELAFQGRELGYAASLVGATVQWAADADARPVLDRILGRPPVHTAAPLSPAIQIATSQLERHSV